jgi:hypothetical protein
MQKKPRLTRECLEQLHTWVHAHCPCALENDDFLPGLWVIIEDEVEQAVQRQAAERWKQFESPSLQ